MPLGISTEVGFGAEELVAIPDEVGFAVSDLVEVLDVVDGVAVRLPRSMRQYHKNKIDTHLLVGDAVGVGF